MERAARIELASSAWKTAALPLSYARRVRRDGVSCRKHASGMARANQNGGWCRSSTARPEGLDALAPRCLTARPTIRDTGWRPRGEIEHPTRRFDGRSSYPLSYEGNARGWRERHLSILVWIKLAWACHDDGERPKGVENLDGAVVLAQHIRQPAIDHRTLVHISTTQQDVSLLQPGVHLLARKA